MGSRRVQKCVVPWLPQMESRKNVEVCVVLAPQNGEPEGRSNWGYVINTEEDEYVSQV
jgi:hypothetical protein